MSTDTHFTLNNGRKIPAVGFGTFADEGNRTKTYEVVKIALKAGYRHLDCAWYYGNEEAIGDAVHDFLKENSSVKREDLFIGTKVWIHLMAPEDVRWSLNDSLKKLRLDYVDSFLIHWPFAAQKQDQHNPVQKENGQVAMDEELTNNPQRTWRAMEELCDAGKAKAIGVSNWTPAMLKDMLSWARIPPAINQVELHPYLPSNELVKFCLDNHIIPEAYSPLGSQGQVMKTADMVARNPTLNSIAEKSGHTLAQILIAWGVRRGYVVLPKSSTPSRVESNFEPIDLSDEDFAAINKVARGRHRRFIDLKDLFGHEIWPGESWPKDAVVGKS